MDSTVFLNDIACDYDKYECNNFNVAMPLSSSLSSIQVVTGCSTKEFSSNSPTASCRRNSLSLQQIRRRCEKYTRRLERYKKSRSLCALDYDSNMVSIEQKSCCQLPCNSSFEPIVASNGKIEPKVNNVDNDSVIVDTGLMVFSSDEMVCQAPNAMQTTSCSLTSPQKNESGQFTQLRDTMLSIMENDIQLLQRLLNLSESLRDLRWKKQHSLEQEYEFHDEFASDKLLDNNSPPPYLKKKETDKICEKICARESSPNDEEDYDHEKSDEFRPLPSRTTITRLYVDSNNWEQNENGTESDIDEDELQPNVQYFSRKNSILRIPIPPRASNRILGKKSCRPNLRPSDVLRQSIRQSVNYSAEGAKKVQTLEKTHIVPAQRYQEDSGQSTGSDSTGTDSPPQHLSPCQEVTKVALVRPLITSPPSSRYSTFSSISSSADSAFENSSILTDFSGTLKMGEHCDNVTLQDFTNDEFDNVAVDNAANKFCHK